MTCDEFDQWFKSLKEEDFDDKTNLEIEKHQKECRDRHTTESLGITDKTVKRSRENILRILRQEVHKKN